MSEIDAEARRRREPIRARVAIDDQVRQDRLDDLSPPPRQEPVPATPDTAIWHEGNDWDEQEER